jgi:hypothetical protein
MDSKDMALVLIVCVPIVSICLASVANSIWGQKYEEEIEEEDDNP